MAGTIDTMSIVYTSPGQGGASGGTVVDVSKISKSTVRNVRTDEVVAVESFWSEKTTVLLFMRRFG